MIVRHQKKEILHSEIKYDLIGGRIQIVIMHPCDTDFEFGEKAMMTLA